MSIEKALRGELIGIEVEVNDIKGIIIDETKNLFLIKEGHKKKKIAKKNNEFIFNFPESMLKIKGDMIAIRPEDRIKIRLPKKWKAEILD